jgi:hypothetical protein
MPFARGNKTPWSARNFLHVPRNESTAHNDKIVFRFDEYLIKLLATGEGTMRESTNYSARLSLV